MGFLADAMLGSLARWLRALGYDTLYDVRWDDDALARRARAEGRLLLTRDGELTRRRNLNVLLIACQQGEEQARQVLSQISLPAPVPFSRCLLCNSPLDALPRGEAEALVPPYVFATQERFSRCPTCRRVYWRGTHWQGMGATLEALCAHWRRTNPMDGRGAKDDEREN